VRAKFQIQSVTLFEFAVVLDLFAVCGDKFGPDGVSEDNTYARFIPSGKLNLTVSNPDLFGKFKPGQKFYLDFVTADAAPQTGIPQETSIDQGAPLPIPTSETVPEKSGESDDEGLTDEQKGHLKNLTGHAREQAILYFRSQK
jgi:hypothetical protein